MDKTQRQQDKPYTNKDAEAIARIGVMLGGAIESIKRFGYYTTERELLGGLTEYKFVFSPILAELKEKDERLRRSDLEIKG